MLRNCVEWCSSGPLLLYASVEAKQLSNLLSFFFAQSQIRLANSLAQAEKLANDSQLDPNVAWYEARNLLVQASRREIASLHSLVQIHRRERKRLCR